MDPARVQRLHNEPAMVTRPSKTNYGRVRYASYKNRDGYRKADFRSARSRSARQVGVAQDRQARVPAGVALPAQTLPHSYGSLRRRTLFAYTSHTAPTH